MSRVLAIGLTIAALIWAVVIVAAPVMWHVEPIAAPLSVVYAAASRVCHQRPERSFFVAGAQMPVCARCSGLYIAGALGALIGWTACSQPRSTVLLALSALPTAITFALEFAGILHFSNIVRAVAALPLGIVAGYVFVALLREVREPRGPQERSPGTDAAL